MQFVGAQGVDLSNPGAIGSATAASGKFTTLTATSAVALASGSAIVVGFYGAAGTAQIQASATPAVATTAAINSSISSSCFGFTSAQATAIVALVNQLRAAAVALGLIAT